MLFSVLVPLPCHSENPIRSDSVIKVMQFPYQVRFVPGAKRSEGPGNENLISVPSI